VVGGVKAGEPCPCGGGAYAHCCSRWHGGPLALHAPTAEALMRSRYSAYALGLHDYLCATWHPATRPASIEPAPPGLRWLGLEVKRHRLIDADHAVVEFAARSKLGAWAAEIQARAEAAKATGVGASRGPGSPPGQAAQHPPVALGASALRVGPDSGRMRRCIACPGA
jgi:SEC-C motif-containing protein